MVVIHLYRTFYMSWSAVLMVSWNQKLHRWRLSSSTGSRSARKLCFTSKPSSPSLWPSTNDSWRNRPKASMRCLTTDVLYHFPPLCSLLTMAEWFQSTFGCHSVLIEYHFDTIWCLLVKTSAVDLANISIWCFKIWNSAPLLVFVINIIRWFLLLKRLDQEPDLTVVLFSLG